MVVRYKREAMYPLKYPECHLFSEAIKGLSCPWCGDRLTYSEKLYRGCVDFTFSCSTGTCAAKVTLSIKNQDCVLKNNTLRNIKQRIQRALGCKVSQIFKGP